MLRVSLLVTLLALSGTAFADDETKAIPLTESDEFVQARRKLEENGIDVDFGIRSHDERPEDKRVSLVTISPNDRVTDDDLNLLLALGPIGALRIHHDVITADGLRKLARIPGLKHVSLNCVPAEGLDGHRVDSEVLNQLADNLELESLQIHGLAVGDVNFEQFREHPRLRKLEVCESGLPNDGLRQIGTWKALDSLWLEGCQVGDDEIKQLAKCQTLSILALRENPITGRGLEPLANSLELRSLVLQACHLTDQTAASLGQFSSVEHMYLDDNQIGDVLLEHLAQGELNRLQSLSLNRTDVTDAGMKQIAQLETLTRLNLQKTRVTGEGMRDLAELKHLNSLDLSHSAVTDETIEGITHLEQIGRLHLDGTLISDKAIPVLAKLKNLQLLTIYGTEITDEGEAALTKALPGCAINPSEEYRRALLSRLSTSDWFSERVN